MQLDRWTEDWSGLLTRTSALQGVRKYFNCGHQCVRMLQCHHGCSVTFYIVYYMDVAACKHTLHKGAGNLCKPAMHQHGIRIAPALASYIRLNIKLQCCQVACTKQCMLMQDKQHDQSTGSKPLAAQPSRSHLQILAQNNRQRCMSNKVSFADHV